MGLQRFLVVWEKHIYKRLINATTRIERCIRVP